MYQLSKLTKRSDYTPFWGVVVYNCVLLFALLYFALGFFPYKPFLAGFAELEESQHGSPAQAPFDKIIFMVVDALRSDFVYSHQSGFDFTHSLISSGSAMPFTARATAPTITMPRVKAITTGSIPSFLDVILNFAESDTTSTLANQDSWLAQMRATKLGKMIMFGDDTWLKLFPETFDRADGTTSFFVSDFTEVDSNVTRHITEELLETDWHTMVLHYLGMDHIGHKSGPRSVNMLPKQREMDSIVYTIYEAISQKEHLESTLLVLCGDHGMNDIGNHGGSSDGETSPALVLVSPKIRNIFSGIPCPTDTPKDFQFYSRVEQSDIAPTLAGLLGFPIPINNLGVFIPGLLPLLKREDQIRILLRNARQILRTVDPGATLLKPNQPIACSDCTRTQPCESSLACRWKYIEDSLDVRDELEESQQEDLLTTLLHFCREAQQSLSNTATEYNIFKLYVGITGALVSVVGAGYMSWLLCTSLISWLLFLSITISCGSMMFASSYVEEEQQFWYWAITAWLVYIFVKLQQSDPNKAFSKGSMTVLILSGIRLTRRWNRTGQKQSTTSETLSLSLLENPNYLWTAIGATYMMNTGRLLHSMEGKTSTGLSKVLSIVVCTMAFGFKVAFTYADDPKLVYGLPKSLCLILSALSLIAQARMVFLGILTLFALSVIDALQGKRHGQGFKSAHTFHYLLTLIILTQSRSSNIPLFLVFEIQWTLLKSLNLSIPDVTTLSLLFQYVSFFALGGSNSISSIDLSNAYNGISGYNSVAVAVLTFVSNWAGPFWWTSATNILLLERSNASKNVLAAHLSLLTLQVAISLLAIMVACTTLRSHLFIWSVFSPKYLYSMAWTMAQHVGVNLVYGSLAYWIGIK